MGLEIVILCRTVWSSQRRPKCYRSQKGSLSRPSSWGPGLDCYYASANASGRGGVSSGWQCATVGSYDGQQVGGGCGGSCRDGRGVCLDCQTGLRSSFRRENSFSKCYSSVKQSLSDAFWYNNLCTLFHVVTDFINIEEWGEIQG